MVLIEPCSPGQLPHVLRQSVTPPPPVRFGEHMDTEVATLIQLLPSAVRDALAHLQKQRGVDDFLQTIVEINVQRGRRAEAIFADPFCGKRREFLTPTPCSESDLDLFARFFHDAATGAAIAAHKRVGIPGTLHRMSLTTHPGHARDGLVNEAVLAITARVGRAMEGIIERMAPFLADGAHTDSLLLIGRPGVGKTTLLREISKRLSTDMRLVVVIVDKTCELGGDALEPHGIIGSARWMPVGRPGLQAQILREAVENQSPDVIICDEISTGEEVEASRTIAQRGVRLIASVHGLTLPEIVNDGERRNLVGGQTSVSISDAAASRRPDKRKVLAARLREPAFAAAIELHEREKWIYHPSVRDAVDAYYNGEPIAAELLEPGKSTRIFAIPDRDAYTYCLECGRLDRACDKHKPAEADQSSFGAPTRQQGSGVCYSCGAPGHISYNCPTRGGGGGRGRGGGGRGRGFGGGGGRGSESAAATNAFVVGAAAAAQQALQAPHFRGGI